MGLSAILNLLLEEKIYMNTSLYAKKNVSSMLRGCIILAASYVCAEQNIGSLADSITQSFNGLTQLMIGIAYVAGIGFGLAGIFKFKQHKDNPTQVPIGTPVSMMFISAALVFLPGLYSPLGYTIFGTGAKLYGGGTTGTGATAIPGFSS